LGIQREGFGKNEREGQETVYGSSSLEDGREGAGAGVGY